MAEPKPDEAGGAEGREGLRRKVGRVIFGSRTTAGRAFDVALIVLILASVLIVLLESVSGIRERYGRVLRAAEWGFTIIFTVEYLLRLWTAPRPARYARSFFGVVDLVAVLPTYISAVLPGAQYLLTVRVLRILRIFRVLKLATYLSEADVLTEALWASRRKIVVFLFTVFTLVVILGSLMYLIEGEENGFTSIPISIYWAIVTLTTVGYGDISPQTPLGEALAAVVMVLGYGIIAVPTGIVTAEIVYGHGAGGGSGGEPDDRPTGLPVRSDDRDDQDTPLQRDENVRQRACETCGLLGHDADARHCKACGELLPQIVGDGIAPAP